MDEKEELREALRKVGRFMDKVVHGPANLYYTKFDIQEGLSNLWYNDLCELAYPIKKRGKNND